MVRDTARRAMIDDEALNWTCAVEDCQNGLHGWWCRPPCAHESRRQSKPPEFFEFYDYGGGPMVNRSWECPECQKRWVTTNRL